MAWNAELDAGLEVCDVRLSVSISQKQEWKITERKCFASSHISLQEFLDIKEGVMTVKVVSFYSRKGRAGVYLRFTV